VELESKYFHNVGALEVYRLKVSALELSHPSACPVFQDSVDSFHYESIFRGEGEGEGWYCSKRLALQDILEV
jgi:hypothetical protein